MAVQNPYVEYIKISRTDELGQDLTTTLEALTQITLPFTNGVNKVYYPISRTRYSDYFLFGLSKNQNSAPLAADGGNLDYNYSSSLSTTLLDFPAVPGSQTLYPTSLTGADSNLFERIQITGYNTVGAGGGTFFGSGIIFKTYPVTPIEASFNVTASVTSGQFTLRLYKIANGIVGSLLSESALISTGTTTLTLSTTTPTGEYGVNDGFALYAYAGAAPGGPPNEVEFSFTSTSNFLASSSEGISPTLNTIPEPYLTSQFKGTDCDVLLNNVDQYPPNRFLQDLDYSGNPNIPINFDQVLEGNAQRGTVPESYYTALSQTNIRYNGSKAQSSDINLFDPYAGTSSFGEPINIGNFGQSPSVTAEDNVIVEFEWAGGTSPEIPGGAQFRLSNRLFEVSSKELVKVVTPDQNVIEFGVKNTIQSGSLGSGDTFIRTISQSRGDYYTVLNNTFGPGKELVPFQYNSILNDELPSFAKVVDNTQWVPGVASFAGTSSYTLDQQSPGSPVGYGYGYWIAGTNYIVIQGQTNFSPLITTEITELGSGYNTDTSIIVNSADKNTGWVAEITYSLKTGNRWFITLIKNFEFPVTTQTATDRFTDVQNGSELNKLGVFEILGIVQGGNGQTHLTVDVTPISFPSNPSQPNILTIGTNLNLQRLENLGFLIWKSRSNYSGQFLTMDQRASGIGPGAIYSRYASETVRKNYEDITREYGSNKT